MSHDVSKVYLDDFAFKLVPGGNWHEYSMPGGQCSSGIGPATGVLHGGILERVGLIFCHFSIEAPEVLLDEDAEHQPVPGRKLSGKPDLIGLTPSE